MAEPVKILVGTDLDPRLIAEGLGPMVDHRPELAAADHATARPATADAPASVVVTGEGVEPVGEAALARAERQLAARAATERWQQMGSVEGSDDLHGERVILVGAGIVNLITAVELSARGASVEVLDGRPDPRREHDWRRLGCTHGGANARLCCLTEADNYNERGSEIYADMRTVFRRRVSEGGWLLTAYEHCEPDEKAWIDRFETLPPWRARTFADDIYAVNTAGAAGWASLRRGRPHLFVDVGLVEGLLRVYTDHDALGAGRALQEQLGALRAHLPARELADRHPGLADAVGRGVLAGGLEVEGFSLNVHDLCARVVAHLEGGGVTFRWSCPVSRVSFSDDGRVAGLDVDDGVARARHYVLAPGAYGDHLLAGTRSEAKVMGVLGLWMFLRNLEPRLERSLKLHREGHVGEDANVTLAADESGRPSLIVGSGYGFVGGSERRRAESMGSVEVDVLLDALHTTCERIFPLAHAEGARDGTLLGARPACVRPFTATGLGIFEVMATDEGGRLVVATGHNTGGFTQAPAVATAVADTLTGRYHAMQATYDPDRGYEHEGSG